MTKARSIATRGECADGMTARMQACRDEAKELLYPLDDREITVLSQIAQARSDEEIADSISTSPQVVGAVRRMLAVKLRLASRGPGPQRVEMSRIAFRAGVSSVWSIPK